MDLTSRTLGLSKGELSTLVRSSDLDTRLLILVTGVSYNNDTLMTCLVFYKCIFRLWENMFYVIYPVIFVRPTFMFLPLGPNILKVTMLKKIYKEISVQGDVMCNV